MGRWVGWRRRSWCDTNGANGESTLGLLLSSMWAGSGQGTGSSRASGCRSQHGRAVRNREFLLESFNELGASAFVSVSSLAAFIASLPVRVSRVTGVSNEDVEFRFMIQCSSGALDEGSKLEVIGEENIVFEHSQSALTGVGGNEC